MSKRSCIQTLHLLRLFRFVIVMEMVVMVMMCRRRLVFLRLLLILLLLLPLLHLRFSHQAFKSHIIALFIRISFGLFTSASSQTLLHWGRKEKGKKHLLINSTGQNQSLRPLNPLLHLNILIIEHLIAYIPQHALNLISTSLPRRG